MSETSSLKTTLAVIRLTQSKTFDVGGGQSIMEEDHHVFQAFNNLQAPMIDGLPTLAGARARASARRPAGQARARVRVRGRASQCPCQGARPVSRTPAAAEERGGEWHRVVGGWLPNHSPGIHYSIVHQLA
jgi:hypothetical protein